MTPFLFKKPSLCRSRFKTVEDGHNTLTAMMNGTLFLYPFSLMCLVFGVQLIEGGFFFLVCFLFSTTVSTLLWTSIYCTSPKL